jgi:hypothetical protein
MKLGTPFFVVVSLINGYVLWSWAIITPRWTVQPGYPLPETGRTIRMLCILLIIATVFVINFALNRLSSKKDANTAILNSIISSNIALVLTLVLSQILDSTYPMFPSIGNTITQLTTNPSILLGILMIVNTFAVGSSVIVWGVFVGINKALGRSTDADTATDIDL